MRPSPATSGPCRNLTMKHTNVRVDGKRRFRWDDYDPAATCGFADKHAARGNLAQDIERLRALQDVFSASGAYGLLVVLQGVDAAGKDGLIKHVISGVNPQGVSVHSFRAPSDDELAHDFLWRAQVVLPARGRIAIFNRSYYEEVLVVRVDPAALAAERLPPELVRGDIWQRRYRQINDFERYLVQNGIIVLKFCLNLSREEQLERLLKRIRDPQKHWKFSRADLETPRHWDAYRDAYAAMLQATSTDEAPWYVVPADRKWVTRLTVAGILVERLAALDLKYPQPSGDDVERFREAERYIKSELGGHG